MPAMANAVALVRDEGLTFNAAARCAGVSPAGVMKACRLRGIGPQLDSGRSERARLRRLLRSLERLERETGVTLRRPKARGM